jgi:hypothetical protein
VTAHAWTNYDDALTPCRSVKVTDDNGTRKVVVDLFACSRCGLVGARDEERNRVIAYGFDVDSLAVMPRAPRCEPRADA